MNYATNTIAVVSILYLLDRWRKSRRRGDGNRASMDAVSASMLLSEVQPKTHAQCSIVTLLVFDDKIPFESFIERFCENFVLSDQESRFRYRWTKVHAAGFEWNLLGHLEKIVRE